MILAPKVTAKHISPNSVKKIRVYLATKLFSIAMTVALDTVAENTEDQRQAKEMFMVKIYKKTINYSQVKKV